jgi:hypothetical protein
MSQAQFVREGTAGPHRSAGADCRHFDFDGNANRSRSYSERVSRATSGDG